MPLITDMTNLHNLFVNNVFGDVFFAAFGLMALFIIMGILMRMSFLTIFLIAGLFAVVFLSLAGNVLFAWLGFVLSISWAFFEIYRFINREGYT